MTSIKHDTIKPTNWLGYKWLQSVTIHVVTVTMRYNTQLTTNKDSYMRKLY